jgi:hypothetical protein
MNVRCRLANVADRAAGHTLASAHASGCRTRTRRCICHPARLLGSSETHCEYYCYFTFISTHTEQLQVAHATETPPAWLSYKSPIHDVHAYSTATMLQGSDTACCGIVGKDSGSSCAGTGLTKLLGCACSQPADVASDGAAQLQAAAPFAALSKQTC